MTKKDLRAEKFEGDMVTKIGFFVPEKINDTWSWYESHNAYGKFTPMDMDAIKAIQAEVLAVCTDK